MRIAILGSVTSVIPPHGQAAIERLVYQQALGLARRGHKILLFAPTGSEVTHEHIALIPVADKVALSGFGKEGISEDESKYGASYKLRLEISNLARVLQSLYDYADEYDVILNNLRGEAVILPVAKDLHKPVYHVMHLPIFPELASLMKEFETRVISISEAQRKQVPDLSFVGTVYNGVDTDEFAFSEQADDYVLYLGSIGKNKNPKDAILAAKAANVRIKIGGRIKDEAYYKRDIEPYIDNDWVVWIGEKHPKEIIELYQKAKAFLFPTKWDEPFGLVMIEAMSCGTPVIAYPYGAVPEVVMEGINGYTVDSVDEMADKIKLIGNISRFDCRKTVLERFAIDTMIDSYEKVLSIS